MSVIWINYYPKTSLIKRKGLFSIIILLNSIISHKSNCNYFFQFAYLQELPFHFKFISILVKDHTYLFPIPGLYVYTESQHMLLNTFDFLFNWSLIIVCTFVGRWFWYHPQMTKYLYRLNFCCYYKELDIELGHS